MRNEGKHPGGRDDPDRDRGQVSQQVREDYAEIATEANCPEE